MECWNCDLEAFNNGLCSGCLLEVDQEEIKNNPIFSESIKIEKGTRWGK
jgi:hypothetical protein